MLSGPVLNVPNSLTAIRILLIPVVVVLLVDGRFDYAAAVLLIAAATDGLDGTIARLANQQTAIGAYLDPLADKLLLTTSFLTLALLGLVPAWLAVLIAARDGLLLAATVGSRLTASRVDISPSVLGKGTTVVQLAYLLAVVVLASQHMSLRIVDPLLYAAAGATLLSGSHYLYRHFYPGAVHARAEQA